MGTTLTGTTPQDTYDSLIKVTDNGPIGTSLKTLTDGLGNDSALGLSNRGLKVNQSATLITDTATLCHFTNNFLYLRGGSAGLSIGDDAFSNSITLADNADIAFETGSAERMRITSTGNVGIGGGGTEKLNVNGSLGFQQSGTQTYHINPVSSVLTFVRSGVAEVMSVTANGLCFGSDTAAANALDDYEEGTWTMSLAFGGASVGVNYGDRTGTYTKIGRQVTATGYMSLSNKGSSTGSATISGLPFTILNSIPAFGVASVRFTAVTFAGQFFAQSGIGTTSIGFAEITEAGVDSDLTNADFADNSTIIVTITYFV